MLAKIKAILLISILTFSLGKVGLAEMTFASWNINSLAIAELGDAYKSGNSETIEAAKEENLRQLAHNSNSMLNDIGVVDTLVLLEVIFQEQVETIARENGFKYWAMSDFDGQDKVSKKPYNHLEVAVLSHYPFFGCHEWDRQSNDEPVHNNRDIECKLSDEKVIIKGDKEFTYGVNRGFLRVDFDNDLSLYAVHWKSSGGGDEIKNAKKREYQATGLKKDAQKLLHEGRSIVVMGDYNITAHPSRSGTNEVEDCDIKKPKSDYVCADNQDGYDDSISILMTLGNKAKLLSKDVKRTYLNKKFKDAAIDHIFVAGSQADTFGTAYTSSYDGKTYFGSDHKPIVVKTDLSWN